MIEVDFYAEDPAGVEHEFKISLEEDGEEYVPWRVENVTTGVTYPNVSDFENFISRIGVEPPDYGGLVDEHYKDVELDDGLGMDYDDRIDLYT